MNTQKKFSMWVLIQTLKYFCTVQTLGNRDNLFVLLIFVCIIFGQFLAQNFRQSYLLLQSDFHRHISGSVLWQIFKAEFDNNSHKNSNQISRWLSYLYYIVTASIVKFGGQPLFRLEVFTLCGKFLKNSAVSCFFPSQFCLHCWIIKGAAWCYFTFLPESGP